MIDAPTDYCGRFAPSPTGPLHFGSLIAALGSYLDARHRRGKWRVRMEDLDPPREMAGAADLILRTLESYGFEWDGPVWYQSRRHDAYEAAIEALHQHGLVYHCACARREIHSIARMGIDGPVYPGTCREGVPAGRKGRSIRIRTPSQAVSFVDRLQGRLVQRLDTEVGDFILRRADGLYAYQLAVVVDDAEQGITDIVRGCDLLDSTPRQRYLQDALGAPHPHYLHLPVATNTAGEKLSKQTHAPAIPTGGDINLLLQCMRFLGQDANDELRDASYAEFWHWAITHWNPARIPARRALETH